MINTKRVFMQAQLDRIHASRTAITWDSLKALFRKLAILFALHIDMRTFDLSFLATSPWIHNQTPRRCRIGLRSPHAAPKPLPRFQSSSVELSQSFFSTKLSLPLRSSLARNSCGIVGMYFRSLSLFIPPYPAP